MTVEISPIVLWNVKQGVPEAAELWDAITDAQLDDWEAEWVPETFKAVQQLKRKGIERRLWPQSRHWDWRAKVAQLHGLLGSQAFSIMCRGMTQGMMTLDLGTKRCRIESQRGQHLVYVDYVENAPWNRQELSDLPRFRGVGSILVRTAIEVSRMEGFKGRIGLHSLPQSEGFYANKCGMTDLGKDSTYQDLRYFEMTAEQAEGFIQKGGQS
jgi:hypothetical protein